MQVSKYRCGAASRKEGRKGKEEGEGERRRGVVFVISSERRKGRGFGKIDKKEGRGGEGEVMEKEGNGSWDWMRGKKQEG